MKTVVTTFILFIVLLIVPFFTTTNAYAASTTIGFSPSNGTFDKPFTVNLVIDGNGDKFNAAEATITPSENLAVQDLTFGDCNFSFLKTPSIQNPSFEGIIMGTSSTKCTIYTLTLVPTAKGDGSISITKASVKRYGDAAEVLSSTQDGSYTLAAALKPTVLGSQLKNTSHDGLYTLYVKVSTANHMPVSQATVVLDQIGTKNEQESPTDTSGTTHFSNLKQGLYDAIVKQGGTKVGEQVINVAGPNHVLVLGIDLATQKNNPLMKTNSFMNSIVSYPIVLIGMLLLGIILGVIVAVLVLKLIGKKHN
ncbi:MAG: hypothetical protein KGL95_03365 [Patescibacteria group bacterium]|nr:hypothetical protein [Patescibacteria group bacterium]